MYGYAVVVDSRTISVVFIIFCTGFTPFYGTCKRPILNTGKSAPPRKLKIQSRWNHHILPYGTVGLRISAGGKCFGYSGDTKYDETINTVLKREELTAAWFAPCDLVFHEIEFNNPSSVHTHWRQVESLQRAISGKVLGYHTAFLENSPFALAKEGCRYLLEDDLKIK